MNRTFSSIRLTNIYEFPFLTAMATTFRSEPLYLYGRQGQSNASSSRANGDLLAMLLSRCCSRMMGCRKFVCFYMAPVVYKPVHTITNESRRSNNVGHHPNNQQAMIKVEVSSFRVECIVLKYLPSNTQGWLESVSGWCTFLFFSANTDPEHFPWPKEVQVS